MQNFEFHIQSALTLLNGVEATRWRIEWILKLKDQFASILNIGCSYGHETIGLLWFLNGEQAVGVDIDSNAIREAENLVETFRSDLTEINRALSNLKNIPSELRSHVELLFESSEHRALPAYHIADITKAIDLPGASFNLAYCHKVLYHVACAEYDTNSLQAASDAIQHVSRLLQRGGLFVAIEPKTCSPEVVTQLDISDLFLTAGLYPVPERDYFPRIEDRRVYCYSKP